MKALILAGGRGTRLRPLTHTTNKHLLLVGNRPMIFRVIEDALNIGIKDIIININKGDLEMQKVIDAGNKRWKVNIDYIEQPEPNGMMYPIYLARKLIGANDFFFSAGDNILSGGLSKHLKDYKKNQSDAHVLVVKRKDYQRFGVAVIKNGKLIKTVEKPKKYVSNLVLTAIYFFKPVVFDAFRYVKPIDPNETGTPEYYPPVVNNWLIEEGYNFTASEVTGWWKDTGKAEDLIEANALVLDRDLETENKGKVSESSHITGRVYIGKNTRIINSVIRGPVSIESDCVVENCYIGPFTSIAKGSKLRNSQVENSILMGGNVIENVKHRIDNSVLGWNSQIIGNDQYVTQNFYIGDNSKIVIG